MRGSIFALTLLILALLTGCGKNQAYILAAQHWDKTHFFVEVRPNPPKAGANEFLVVATQDDGKPAASYVISIHSNATTKWIQTIQDGHSGVYRRAIKIGAAETEVLYVQIKSTDPSAPRETELQFKLTQTH